MSVEPDRAASTALPTTMQAVVQDTYGSYEVLQLREIAVPVPAAGEVLIKVRATSLNAADWHVMAGEPLVARAVLGLRRPKETIQGRDVAGRWWPSGPRSPPSSRATTCSAGPAPCR